MSADAVVIGSGPNGLAAAITLAGAGLEVEVHEAAETIGGGVRSAELTRPGFVHDICSCIYPFGLASPFFRELELDLEFIHPPAAAAHPLDDGSAVLLERDIDVTAAQLAEDAEAYRRLIEPLVDGWRAIEPVVLAPLTPPSARAVVRLARTLGARGALIGARSALGTARGLAEHTFDTERARAFFAGHAAHSILPLERRPSGAFGLLLTVLGHVSGWPLVRGGSQRLAEALADRVRSLGGSIRTSSPVETLPDARLVLADVAPPELARIAGDRLPDRYVRQLRRFRFGPGAFKLDWALDGPIPWRAPECARAGTVHLGGTLAEIAAWERGAWGLGEAEAPFVLLVQPSLFDETRAPTGKHTAWAYSHLPNGSGRDLTGAIEAQVERFAPGFRDLILERSVLDPAALEHHNRNLVGGDVAGGAMTLRQVLFRPAPAAVPYRTPREGLYLCSASTPPGGGVHGMCGYLAARAALKSLGKAPRAASSCRRPRTQSP
jgi:phytoene dehydrogenase-like protein